MADEAPPSRALPGIPDKFANLPAIEIELINEIRRPPTVEKTFAMVEVWTQNRIYRIDVNMVCIDVVEIGSNTSDREHGLLGARLLGGQHTEQGATFLSHPFPRPGTEAVFEQSRPGGGVMFSHSSTVTRVVLRLRQLSIMTGGAEPTWDQIAMTGRKSSLPGG